MRRELEPLPRGRGVGRGRDAADAGDEEHARLRVEHRRPAVRVPLEVRLVRRLERGDPLVGIAVEQARACPDPEHVVGRAPPRGDVGRVGPVGEVALAAVDREHLPPPAGEAAPQPCKSTIVPRGFGGRGKRDGRVGPVFREGLARARHELEHEPVRLLVRPAPRDEAVVGEDDRAPVGERGHAARELEPRADVLDDGDVVPERVAHRARRVGRVRERADRVGVDVVDVRGGQERVQQRLDRRPRRVRVDHAAGEVGEHLVVGQRLALAEREQVVEPQPREVAHLGGREVGAAALDPDRAPLAAEMVALDELGGGVPAAVEDERAVGADQPRAGDEPFELGLAGDRGHGQG